MGQMLIHDVDESVLEALQRRAAVAGTSPEEEARRMLADAVGLERAAAAKRLGEIRKRIGQLQDGSIVDDLRRDRCRDGS